jgi:hypothetical protein
MPNHYVPRVLVQEIAHSPLTIANDPAVLKPRALTNMWTVRTAHVKPSVATTWYLLYNYRQEIFIATKRFTDESIHGTKSRQHSNRTVPPDVHYTVGLKLFKEGP